jgi:hypothetical protein
MRRELRQRLLLLLFVSRDPLFGRKRIVGSRWATANVTRKTCGKDQRLFIAKDAEHIFYKRPNLVSLALFLGINVLQVCDHIHDLVEALLHLLFLFFEVVEELRDIINRALAFGAFGRRLEDTLRLLVAQDDITSCGRGGHLKRRYESHSEIRCAAQRHDRNKIHLN